MLLQLQESVHENKKHQECYKMKRVYSVLVTVRGEREMSLLLLFL